MVHLMTASEVLRAVRRLHNKRTFNGDGYGWSVCAECRQAWPCATEDALADLERRDAEQVAHEGDEPF